MTPIDADIAIIGAGVVGMAIAREVATAGFDTLVLERHLGAGRETSSHNSQVIHAGIYYPPGSNKAQLCVAGNRMLYQFCHDYDVPHRRLEKLVVACTADELPELEQLRATGTANGAPELEIVGGDQVKQLEPSIRACGALHSRTSGIVDVHELIKTLEGLATEHGAMVVYRSSVRCIEFDGTAYDVTTTGEAGETDTLRARIIVNAAGLESDTIAKLAGLSCDPIHWCQGDYFSVSGPVSRSVNRLIYPVPGAKLTGLGIHITLDMAGRMLLGPDATYVQRGMNHYDVSEAKATHFHRAVTRYLPTLPLEALQPDSCGLRPKLQGPNDPWRDFYIEDENAAGRPGFINLMGIESPGLTASLAIAKEVLSMVNARIG